MISVIIPVYNVGPYIEECVYSVLSQRYRTFEVIIVDDCGTDNSMDLVYAILKGKEDTVLDGIHFRIIRHDRNKGISEARNTGLKSAIGDYIFLLDSDDTITEDCLSLLADKAKETNADVIDARVNSVYPDISDYPEGFFSSVDDIRNIFFKRKLHTETWGRLLKRGFIEENHLRFIKDILCEDVPFGLQVFSKVKTLYCLKEKCYNYRMRPGSIMSHENFELRLKSYETIIEQLVQIATDNQIIKEPGFVNWLEFYKALFFRNIAILGSSQQLWWFYKQVVRKIHRTPELNKDNIHYLFPSFIGFYVYQRFYGRRLC